MIERLRAIASHVRPRRITPTTPPVSLTDSLGRAIEIRPYSDSDSEALVSMYETFDKTQRAQGVPPLESAAIEQWLHDILGGVNVVAVHGDRIVGHVSFVEDGTGRHELAIFVHQEYQQAGIGSQLMAAGLGHARQHGVGYMWLTVEKTKRYQQRFYNRAGFSAVNNLGFEIRMSRSV